MTSKNGIVLALRGQEDGALVPSYGRNSTITGDIGLNSTEDVVAVSVKVSGSFPFSSVTPSLIR